MWPQLINLCNFGPGMGKTLTFEQQMTILPGLIAWWPQTEASGTVADNAEGTAARDAAYFTDANVTQRGATFPVSYKGINQVALYAPLGRLRFGTASLATAWNWNNGWTVLWALPNATEQADSSKHGWQRMFGVAGKTNFYGSKATTPYQVGWVLQENGGVSHLTWIDWIYSPNYTMIAMYLNPPNGYVWRNGVLALTSTTIAVSTDSALDISNVDFNVLAMGDACTGAFPHFAMGASQALTTTIVNNLYESAYPANKQLFACGDSKTTNNDYWISKLLGNLEYSAVHPGEVWRERPYRVGLTGQTTAQLHTYLDANLASMTGNPVHCCVNVGSNDLSGGTAETPFKAGFTGVIDALLARWPSTKVWVTKPYREDVATPTSPATLAGWIDDVIATYTGGNVAVGNDETGWFATGIATYSDDGCHPNNAGHIEAANQWQAALGY